MVRRKNSPLYDSFLLCRNSIRKDLSHIAHKRRNARFNGLWRVNTPPQPPNRAQRLTRRNRGRFGWGRYHYPRSVFRGSETLRGRDLKRQTLPLLGLGRGYSRRTQKACGTAMRLCASLSRGVAAPLGCVIPLLFLSPHRWASRFCSAASLAHRKLSTCSLVTAVRFWDRCLRRSMRGTCLSERRSGCRF